MWDAYHPKQNGTATEKTQRTLFARFALSALFALGSL